MSLKSSNALKNILHPYVFVLKEGKKIKKDYLDYSLMMLQLHSAETIYSPTENPLTSITALIEQELQGVKKNS